MSLPVAHFGHFVQIAPFVMPPLIVVAGLVGMVVADRLRGRRGDRSGEVS